MASGKYFGDSIFWVEVGRIRPNPFQPRRTFDDDALASLAESIRQYGVLQPLTVTKRETERPDEGIFVEYELIAGERRWRAAERAGVSQVPVVIRTAEESDQMKLELAIIENLQREDLNAVDRARAFQKLVDEFGMNHTQVAKKVGRSREYVSNTIRILALSEEILQALVEGRISDGHTRPLLMLVDKPEEQTTLFKEIVDKHMTVRESERVARRIAVDKTRKHDLTPELLSLEKEFTEAFGTRVRIEQKEHGGKLHIDYFSDEDLETLRQRLVAAVELQAAAQAAASEHTSASPSSEEQAAVPDMSPAATDAAPARETEESGADAVAHEQHDHATAAEEPVKEHTPAQESEPTPSDAPEEDADLYSIRNFSV